VLLYVLVRDAGDAHPEWRALYDAWSGAMDRR
jgi:hypothetical protein